MIIKRAAVGNEKEAFIENNFVARLNVISSDDNNKGKTIIIQSMMYALGNEPTFPTTFNYKEYYHYIEFEENEITYILCRYNNGFILKYNNNLMIFDNVSELKRYWTKHIFRLPVIAKNQMTRIVDPVLFLQLFFIGQDKKDTSTISHSGFYHKADYYNMLYDICDVSGVELNEYEVAELKKRIAELKSERAILLRQHKILKSNNSSVSYFSATNDREMFGKKIQAMEKIKSKIEELRKSRNIAATRKAKWETTIKELRSLNRTMESGELRCMDCNSTNISFSSSKKNAYAFDVSSDEMRKEIIESIDDKVSAYSEEIERLATEINLAQEDLQKLMSDDNVSLETLVAYKNDIFNASDAELKIREIDEKLETLKNQIAINSTATTSKKEKQVAIINNIVEGMNKAYHSIDSSGNLYFDDLFTKRDEVYSGSEATVFHLVKLYSIRNVIKHNYPIIIDSFRAEDLSTTKEDAVISLYGCLSNQIIFTTTLKKEEIGKYDGRNDLHHIDYKDHQASKMLASSNVPDFLKLLNNISVKLQ